MIYISIKNLLTFCVFHLSRKQYHEDVSMIDSISLLKTVYAQQCIVVLHIISQYGESLSARLHKWPLVSVQAH